MIGRAMIIAAAICAMIILITGASASAPGGPWDDQAIPVANDKGLYCTLDARNLKRYNSLSGVTLVDIWVNYKLNDEARVRARQMPEEFPEGINFDQLANLSIRYLFRIEPADSNQPPLRIELEKKFTDEKGRLLGKTDFRAPWAGSIWGRLGNFEQKVLAALLKDPWFYRMPLYDTRIATYIDISGIDDGILGQPWGMQPGAFPNASLVGEAEDNISTYHLTASAWPILGDVRAYSGLWLQFSKDKGLIGARIPLQSSDVEKVVDKFHTGFGRLVLSKHMGDRSTNSPDELWSIGRNTRAVLISSGFNSYLDITRAAAGSLKMPTVNEKSASAEARNSAEMSALQWQTLWGRAAEDGVLGIPWGSRYSDINSLLAVSTFNLNDWKVVFTDIGIPKEEKAARRTLVRLFFSEDKGLVLAAWDFDAQLRPALESQLRSAWGTPRSEKAGTLTWQLGKHTISVLDFDRSGEAGTLTIAEDEFWQMKQRTSRGLI